MKALKLLKTAKSVKERAEKYVGRIGTSIEIDMLIPLREEIENMEDKIFDLENFSLDTDHNKGLETMTKEVCEERFKSIINLKFQIKIKTLELKAKEEAFNDLFGEEKTKK